MSKQQKNMKMNWKTILGALAAVLILIVGGQLGLLPEDGATDGAKGAAVPAQVQEVADYIFGHGELPDRFITKREAEDLGWDSSRNYVSDVAPGKAIGGDRFGNYEGLLPDAPGRTWYEADVLYTSGKRGAERIVFSSDGLIYYTPDHYASFELLYGEED